MDDKPPQKGHVSRFLFWRPRKRKSPNFICG